MTWATAWLLGTVCGYLIAVLIRGHELDLAIAKTKRALADLMAARKELDKELAKAGWLIAEFEKTYARRRPKND